MDRREMIRTTAVGIAGLGVSTAFTGCSPKNLSNYVSVVVSSLQELSPLLPGQAQFITKAVSIAKQFDEAYRAGKFVDATALFDNLAGIVSQVAESAGVSSPSVKVAIAVAGIAMRAIAMLLKSQADDPLVSSIVADKTMNSATMARQKALIEKLANEKEIDALFRASKP